MSRVGKKPVILPKGVKAGVVDRNLTIEGPKGKLTLMLEEIVDVKIEGEQLLCGLKEESADDAGARHGLTRSLVANMVKGVAEGFKKELEVSGVGFRANVKGRDLELSLGFSHPVIYRIRDGITISVDAKSNRITVSGADRQLVGQTAAEIKAFRKPEPYKGKGIKYADEVIRRKAGKAAASTSSAG